MLKELLARTSSLLPRALSRIWATDTYTRVGNPRSSPVTRESKKLIPHTSKGHSKSSARHTKQATHNQHPKTQSRRPSPKGLSDLANSALKGRSGKALQQPKNPIRGKSEGRQKTKAAGSAQPGGSTVSQPGSLSFLDGDCVHANKALFLDDRVSQYRSKLLLRVCKASMLLYKELVEANQMLRLDIEGVEKIIGYRFQEPRLLVLVFVHMGTLKADIRFKNAQESHGSQQALMWIGDAILQFLITEQLIARYDTADSFQLHEARVRLISRRSCATKSRELGLDKHCIHGGALRGFTDSMLAEMYEALIGVIYLDGGWEAASLFFARHIQLPERLEDLS